MIFGFIAIFSALFALNFFLSINSFLGFGLNKLSHRIGCWMEILVASIAVYYVLKFRKFNLLDLCVAVLLGIVVKFAGSFGYISAFSTTLAYYSGCQIFRFYNLQDKFFNLNLKKTFIAFGVGSLAAIPFAIINNLAISQTGVFGETGAPKDVLVIFKAALNALPPGINEEVIWRFFLSAFVLAVFRGKVPKNKSTNLLIYFLLVVPHCIMHLPDMFIQNKLMALYSFVFMAVLFGKPMAWIFRNRNLQTVSAFHWCIDFIRFCFGS